MSEQHTPNGNGATAVNPAAPPANPVLPATAGRQQPAAPPDAAPTAVWPVSQRRIEECLSSADYWGDILSFHADRLQKRADAWSVAAALLAAIAGLSAWKLVSDNPEWWAVTLTSALALAAAACAVVPRIKNYAETAGVSRELAPRYADSKGQLTDALAWMKERKANRTTQTPAETTAILAIVKEFESIKRTKDSMRYLPLRSAATRAKIQVKRTPLGGRNQVKREQRAARDETAELLKKK